jgi:hypothetical protein
MGCYHGIHEFNFTHIGNCIHTHLFSSMPLLSSSCGTTIQFCLQGPCCWISSMYDISSLFLSMHFIQWGLIRENWLVNLYAFDVNLGFVVLGSIGCQFCGN